MSAAPEEGCRPAMEDDLPRLVELVDAAVTDLRAGRGGAVWARHNARRPPYEAALRSELSSPDHHVLVGPSTTPSWATASPGWSGWRTAACWAW